MGKLMLNPEFNLYEREGKAFCSSRQVAEEFDRQHPHILRLVGDITQSTSGFSKGFISLNFQEGKYKDSSGRWNKEYLMTKDGFAALAMEIKGRKARQFKEAYINRFNQMEAFIRSLAEAKADFPEFTQAILQAHEEPKHYHFSNELDMINRIVLGMSSKQFKEAHNLGNVNSVRPYLTPEQAESIKNLQRIDIGLILAIPDFQVRKQMLSDQHNRRQQLKVIAS